MLEPDRLQVTIEHDACILLFFQAIIVNRMTLNFMFMCIRVYCLSFYFSYIPFKGLCFRLCVWSNVEFWQKCISVRNAQIVENSLVKCSKNMEIFRRTGWVTVVSLWSVAFPTRNGRTLRYKGFPPHPAGLIFRQVLWHSTVYIMKHWIGRWRNK
jgi:hypothetical protein